MPVRLQALQQQIALALGDVHGPRVLRSAAEVGPFVLNLEREEIEFFEFLWSACAEKASYPRRWGQDICFSSNLTFVRCHTLTSVMDKPRQWRPREVSREGQET